MPLYVEGFGRRIQAAQLSKASGEWIIGGANWTNLGKESVWHEPLETAQASSGTTANIGEENFEFAQNLAEALGNATLPASESDTTGRIVVFADENTTGPPSKEICIEALGLERTIDGMDLVAESKVSQRDWHTRLRSGFCYEDDEEIQYTIDSGDGRNARKILATTELMARDLTDHFEYNMSDAIVCAPVLYGGRHGNGNAIVAVLSMRVWT